MNSVIYERVGRVHFKNGNIGAGVNYIRSFEDSYDTITITTEIEVDFIERGWLGDITYWAGSGLDLNDYEKRDLTSEPRCIKDALCIRVEVRSKPDCPVEWMYTFLKY